MLEISNIKNLCYQDTHQKNMHKSWTEPREGNAPPKLSKMPLYFLKIFASLYVNLKLFIF